MLSQLQRLSLEADGRYATDAELEFIVDYARSYSLRVQTYQKLQIAEEEILQQLYTRMRRINPHLFLVGEDDYSNKWRRDTMRVLRYSAAAMLLNDSETLRERLLLWFQTIMKAFGTQRSCDVTYTMMQEVVKQHLNPIQASLFCPILELNRRFLGISA